ncbi:MAG TPA: DMT family transporter [Candidatus Binatia bacterium]|nr:DMT family transporter [Candidatus Binatia bacterium]
MFAEIVAIFSAMGWAGDSVLVRLGLRQSNIFAAMLVSYTVSVTCIWTYLLITTPLDFLRSPAMIYFLVSGCLQPLFARALYYQALTRIGVSRAGPLRGAEPFFATAIAVTVLHEQPTFPVYVGTVLIVGSVWAISSGQTGKANWRFVDVLLPLGAALVSAISQTLRKQGLNILPNPFVAAATVTSVTLTLLLIFLVVTRRTGELRLGRKSSLFFLTAALVALSAQVANFIALSQAEVSVIIPLLNTTPLFTVLFSTLFLRSLETVTPRIIFGAILMVAGMITITSR